MIGCVVNPVGLSGAAVFAAEGADVRGMNHVLRLNMICKAQLATFPLYTDLHFSKSPWFMDNWQSTSVKDVIQVMDRYCKYLSSFI
jgi:hypothetical protein